MKDYRLSEIKAICDDCVGDCDFCEISHECDFLGIEKYPTHWENIEPRDMIELPCKEKNTWGDVVTYDVIYRDKYGHIQVAHDFFEEIGADEFLQELQNGKV